MCFAIICPSSLRWVQGHWPLCVTQFQQRTREVRPNQVGYTSGSPFLVLLPAAELEGTNSFLKLNLNKEKRVQPLRICLHHWSNQRHKCTAVWDQRHVNRNPAYRHSRPLMVGCNKPEGSVPPSPATQSLFIAIKSCISDWCILIKFSSTRWQVSSSTINQIFSKIPHPFQKREKWLFSQHLIPRCPELHL